MKYKNYKSMLMLPSLAFFIWSIIFHQSCIYAQLDESVNKGFVVVGVESLLPDIPPGEGTEIDDGDNDDNTKTFVIPVATSGVVTVKAKSKPLLTESELPPGWQMTGGNGTDKLERTVDKTSPGKIEIKCECGDSYKNLTLYFVKFEVKSVHFTSDYESGGNNIFKNNITDWTDNGSAYTEPEWVKSSSTNNPILHKRNQKLHLDVVLKVEPSGISFDIVGDGTYSYLDFNLTGIGSTGSDQIVAIEADVALPNIICVINENISWKIRIQSAEFNGGNTGVHKIFVTYDSPIGSVPTEKRLVWACNRANSQSSINGIVQSLHAYINTNTPPKFNVATDEWPSGTPPIWMMLDPTHSGGSCIAHSNLLKHSVNILGVAGGVLDKVWSSTNTNFDSQETHLISGRVCVPVVVVDRGGGGYEWNYYEACLNFNNKYYPGAYGTSSFNSKNAVHDDYAAWPNRLIYLTVDAPRRFFDKDHTEYTNPLAIPQNKCIPLP